MSSSPSIAANEIRSRMRAVRGKLPDDVQGIVTGAKQLVDWRHYVRAFPWGALGAAVAAGYFAVPRKLQVVRPDVKTLEELAKRQKLVVEPTGRIEQPASFLQSAASLAGGMLLKAGLNYASRRAGALFAPPNRFGRSRNGSRQDDLP